MEVAVQDKLHGGVYPLVAQQTANRTLFVEEPPKGEAVRARNKDWNFGEGVSEFAYD